MNKQLHSRPVGCRLFTDGARRHVFEDAAGQYVLDPDGQSVREQWLLPADEPVILAVQAG